ncbi:hypothetical protein BD309DRAFT_868996 [Dichomitus squalens]|uniref:DUF6593 domain-containing protein n=1 Tax=Dichomitus squalens TaxID=114155 RepID=A0A4Q9NIM6_9APHY|nr:hypothetical protein BD311DRAFT_668362 [Dichomitus squalens]TBU41069.1 hypothetical protein BD309DRAFT_868996 [Dichomitus squalens]TBU55214.1 hypothetical protein BD310DRAFT_826331 [Dichomitus squalens]
MLATSSSVYHIRSPVSPVSSKTHKLVLTTTSLRNVVLANSSDVLYYEVVTPAWERHRTRVSRLDPNAQVFSVVAEMLNGHAPEDTKGKEEDAKRAMALRWFGGGEYVAVNDFLHFAWFRGKDGRKYTWYGDKKRLELRRDDRPDRPVASYHKEKRLLHVLRISQYPYLEVDRDPAVIETLDYVVVSFLLVERLRRDYGCD